ncbi:hypothetical protein CSB20_06595 [bacterium DOLZORAL124_64_63]|nr:MAG: hypothetical protein CSB20_06595 [bacterium DOLZORAL124_64_63]
MRGWYLLMGLLAALALVTLAGCKEEAPKSELDIFIEHMDNLPAGEQADTLATLAAGTGRPAAWANYILGNRLYAAAADSAVIGGWSTPVVTALLEESEGYLTAAIERDSTFVEALVNLGSLWDDRSEVVGPRAQRDRNLAQAKHFYEKALAINPRDEKARCNLGGLYLRQRKIMEAKQEFTTVLENNPHSALAHYNLAIMFAESKIYREAIAEWELAVKYDPDGDIGQRSSDNIKIVKDLMKTPVPAPGKGLGAKGSAPKGNKSGH